MLHCGGFALTGKGAYFAARGNTKTQGRGGKFTPSALTVGTQDGVLWYCDLAQGWVCSLT